MTLVFAEQLKARRKELKLSQENLAESLFISRQAISKWENGEAVPDLEMVVRLADMLEISLDALLTGKTSEKVIERIIEKEVSHTMNFWEFLSKRENRWILIVVFVLLFFAIAMH